MNIVDYISFKFNGELISWENQYETIYPKLHYSNRIEDLQLELWNYFYKGAFSEEKASKKRQFLNYLYAAYPEDKSDFINFVKKSIKLIPNDVLDLTIRIHLENDFQEDITAWLAKLNADTADSNLGNADFLPRIKPKRLSLEEIKGYFMNRLTAVSEHTGKQIMTEAQVQYFLQANIAGFEPQVRIQKIITKGSFKDVSGAVYDFYKQENPPLAPVKDYVNMGWEYFEDLTHYKDKVSYSTNFGKFSQLR